MNTARHGRGHLRPVTARERDILTLLTAGVTDPAISEQLGISLHTVKSHIKNLREKLGATDRQHAVRLALEAGIIRRGELA